MNNGSLAELLVSGADAGVGLAGKRPEQPGPPGEQWAAGTIASEHHLDEPAQTAQRQSVRLDRDVLIMTAIVFAANYTFVVVRSIIIREWNEPEIFLARTVTSVLAIGLAFLMHKSADLFRLRSPARRLLFASATAPLASATVLLIDEFAFRGLTDVHDGRPFYFHDHLPGNLLYFVWVFVAWSGLYAGLAYAAEARERERSLALAEAAANQAQLTALRYQLNPHFLFNTLNTIAGLIGLDRRREAEEMTLGLASFLRYSLAAGADQIVPLRQEIEAEERYLSIERVRFPDRFEFRVDCPESLDQAQVPSLILQPLIENAMKYAVTPSSRRVTLNMSARVVDGRLTLTVEDDGPGAHPRRKTEPGLGIGLANVRRRLASLYGASAGLTAAATPNGGFSARIHMPMERAP
jgi:signal transduction histidine kinase